MSSSVAAATSAGPAHESEHWRFVECCRCRDDILVPIASNAGTIDTESSLSALREDFWLTSCGHVACARCLEGGAAL
jgi:hypothetical protein